MIPPSIALAGFGAYLNAGTAVFAPELINAVASFGTNGVMANCRSDPAGAPNRERS